MLFLTLDGGGQVGVKSVLSIMFTLP